MTRTGYAHGLRTLAIIVFGIFANLVLAQEAARVSVIQAKITEILDEFSLTGTVTSERHAALSPRVSGLVSKVHVDAGDRVKKGEPLIDLDRAFADLELRRADAAVTEAQARLAESIRLRDEARELVSGRSISESQALSAEARVRVREAALSRLRTEREQQAETVRRHTIIAPFAGVISRKRGEAGEWVQTGAAVLDLIADRQIRLDIEAPQERFHDLRVGATAAVRLDALPGHVFHGRVRVKVPVKDVDARTFLVRVGIDDPELLITPGMSGFIQFRIPTGRRGVMVPLDALVRSPDGSNSAWIVNERDGTPRVSRRTVQVGHTLSAEIEIRNGLRAGQMVVIRGNEVLREGQPVQLVD